MLLWQSEFGRATEVGNQLLSWNGSRLVPWCCQPWLGVGAEVVGSWCGWKKLRTLLGWSLRGCWLLEDWCLLWQSSSWKHESLQGRSLRRYWLHVGWCVLGVITASEGGDTFFKTSKVIGCLASGRIGCALWIPLISMAALELAMAGEGMLKINM